MDILLNNSWIVTLYLSITYIFALKIKKVDIININIV